MQKNHLSEKAHVPFQIYSQAQYKRTVATTPNEDAPLQLQELLL